MTKTPNEQTPGGRVKMLIDALGIKQVDFAKLLGIDTATLSRICTGKRRLTKGMISQIVGATQASKDWLESGEGEMLTIGNAYQYARAAGASPLAASIFAQYMELAPETRKAFEDIASDVFIEAFRQKVKGALSNETPPAGATINQTGNNNRARIG